MSDTMERLRDKIGELLFEALEEGVDVGVKLERERWISGRVSMLLEDISNQLAKWTLDKYGCLRDNQLSNHEARQLARLELQLEEAILLCAVGGSQGEAGDE